MAFANWMTLGLSPIPRPQAGIQGFTAPYVFSDQTGKIGWGFCVSQPRKIVALGVNIKTGSNKQYRLSLQGMFPGQSGSSFPAPYPDGVVLTAPGGQPVQVDFTSSTSGFQWFTLPANRQYTPVRGQFISLVMQQLNIDGSGSSIITAQTDFAQSSFPWSTEFNGLNWGVYIDRYPVAAIRYEGSTQPAALGHPCIAPDENTPALATTNPSERLAMRFMLPAAGTGASFKVAGVKVQASMVASNQQGVFRLGLWRPSDNMLLQFADLGYGISDPVWSRWGYRELYFTNATSSSSSSSSSSSGPTAGPYPLSFGVPYYVGFQRLTGAQDPNVNMDFIEVREYSATTYPYEDMDAYPGGKEIYAGHYKQVGGVWQWVEYKNRRPLFDLILADFNAGT